MKQIKAAAASYARSAVAGCLAVYLTGNTNPKDLAMGLIAGIVPVLSRWANKNDVSFGIKK